MNDYDRETLVWLMTADKRALAEFYKDLNTADVLYLLKLLQQSEATLEDVGLRDADPVEDFTEAKQVLAKFRLKN
jgi:hypothetical protein